MRVAFVILDAQPTRHVNPETTPVLAGLAAAGGWAREGGQAVLTSATYPNHATFVTGTDASVHGLYANHVVHDGRVARAYDVGPAAPTIFDACRDAGRSTTCVFGDHHLVGVMGAAAADSHWPVDGLMPAGRRLDDMGYLHDEGTIPELCAAAAETFDLLVSQLNGPDTASHVHGPDSTAAKAAFTETDGYVGQLVEALRPSWDDTVMIVVSDHDQTTIVDREPIDVQAAAGAAALDVKVVYEGDGAVVVGHDPLAGSWLDDVPGILGATELAPGVRFVSAERGRWFAPSGTVITEKGIHGGLSTRAQVAVVGGGHPAVAVIAASLAARRPDATDWAPTMAALLDVPLPTATGRSLLS